MENKTINNITLYDLMAEDLDVYVAINKSFGLDLTIENEEGDVMVDEKGIHPFAAESFSDFCRRYLAFYDKATKKEAA